MLQIRDSNGIKIAIVLATCLAGFDVPAAGGRVFTVRDSIETVKLQDPDASMAAFRDPIFNLSPDARHVAIVVSRGNLRTGLSEFSIKLLDVEKIQEALKHPSQATRQVREIVKMQTRSSDPAISNVRWTKGGRQLAYIGKDEDRLAQVLVYDLDRQVTEQITRHGSDIVTFGVSENGNVVVYAAKNYPDWNVRKQYGYTVTSEYLGSLLWTDATEHPDGLRYFVIDTRSKVVRPIEIETSRYGDSYSISPSESQALLLALNVRGMPLGWDLFRVIRESADPYNSLGRTQQAWNNDAFGALSGWFGRLVLADLKTGRVTFPVDAPFIPDRGFQVVWAANGDSVLLLNSLLPISSSDGRQHPERAEYFFVAELDLRNSLVLPVVQLGTEEQAVSGRWISYDEIEISTSGSATSNESTKRYKKLQGQWQQVTDPVEAAVATPPGVEFAVTQGVNLPVDITATEIATGRELKVTNLNPQLQDFRLGSFQDFDWYDEYGHSYQGGLLLPPDFDEKRTYPLVIQTYGFDRNTFLLDGPFGISSAYAARPLASAGFVVLQLPFGAEMQGDGSDCRDWSKCGENPKFVQMLDSAIESLIDRELIDKQRIGIIGFSREGMHAFYAAAFSRHNIAAITVADSVGSNPFSYAMFYGFAFPGMLDYESDAVFGGAFWGIGKSKWLERSPMFHLERINAAIRFETYGPVLSGYVAEFAILKRASRPVELVHLPTASHLLQQPHARYTSQQGNVDWFRFWLKDEEDSSPAKFGQYRAWRLLKNQAAVSSLQRQNVEGEQ